MSFIRTNRTGRKTPWASRGRALAALSLLVLGLRAQAQVSVQTIGGGPRLNSCAAFAGFAEGDTYTNAQFNDPYASALDSQSNLWVADTGNSDVEEISQAGNLVASVTSHLKIVTTLTNKSGKISFETNSHPFPKVNGVAVDSAGNLYVMMPTNGLLLKYDSFLNPLSEIFFTDAASVPMASALSVDASSNVFMAFTNGMIVRFRLTDGFPAPVYSNSFVSGGQLPMHYVVPSFHWKPVALALRSDGQLAVSDTLSNAIYLVATNDDSAPTLLTGGNGAGWQDGAPQYAKFDQPHGIAASADGRMVVCDTMNNRVRIIDTLTNTTTLYGTASNVWTATFCDDVPALFAGWVDGAAGTSATSASGREPVSVTISGGGTLFVTEQFYDLIRGVTGSGLTPVNAVGIPLGLGPVVTTLFASNITANSAILNSAVNAEGEPAAAYFQWGVTSSNGNVTMSTNLTVNLNNTNIVSLPLTNLQPATTYFYQGVAANSTGTGSGSELVFTTLPSQQPTISFGPNSGYFPECVTISVTSSVPTVYFTTDGSTPTTNGASVTLVTNTNSGDFIGTLQWCNPLVDLTSLRIAAFNGAVSSTISAGESPSANLVGFPKSTQSGAGDVAYIPVVVDLESNGTLKSLQFRVEVTPNDTNTPMIPSLTLQAITPNDFVQFAGPSPGNVPVSMTNFPVYTTASNGLGVLVSASGSTSGLDIQNFGVAVLLRVQIPKNAAYGQSYSLNVLYPTGTSDGIGDSVGLEAMPAQTLTITDPVALAGDSAPPTGYNNGEFGNGELDNSDANAVLYALLNIRRPYSDSDAYKAMDVFPETAVIIGNGFLTFLDWQTVLYRSVGLDTNNWIRFWTNGNLSHEPVSWSPGGPPVPLSENSSAPPVKLSLTPTPPGLVWFCQFSIGSGTVANGLPGNTCSLPIYARVLPGYDVSGMAFRATALPDDGAPAVGQIQFNPASNIPAPQISPGLSANDIVCAWNVGEFTPPLQGSNYLGTISFQIPAAAQSGASYTLQFVVGGGAPDLTTEYQMESFPGKVWVGTAAQQPPSLTSDEWKTSFFGSTTNALAADNVDADGDGMPNWMEYLAGTNPTNASSRFQFSSATFNTDGLQGVTVNWLTAPGKTYILESEPALGGKNWTAINTNSGDGNYFQLLITNYSGNSRFYQILLQP